MEENIQKTAQTKEAEHLQLEKPHHAKKTRKRKQEDKIKPTRELL